MKRALRWALGIVVVVLLGGAASLAWLLRLPPLTGDLNRDLQQIVAQTVASDPVIRNAAVAVRRGRDGFFWAGAAGFAHRASGEAMAADPPIFIASVTKLFVATAVMRLAEKGALSLDDPMAKYLPADLIARIAVFEGRDYSGAVTVRELLAHRSGIPDYYSEPASDGKTLFELLKADPAAAWSVDAAIARARDNMKPGFAPGTKTAYSDANYQLLGKIVEKAAGAPLHVVFETEFFRPLGLDHTYLLGRARAATPGLAAPADVFDGDVDITRARYNPVYWADGGLVSTPSDMIAFLEALNRGRLVRPETLQAMHDWRDWRFPLQYGLGTMRFAPPSLASRLTGLPPLWGHSGSTGSFLYYSAADDVYVAGTLDQTKGNAKTFAIIRKVLDALRSE